MRIKRILMFVIVSIVLIVGMGLISIKWKQKVEVKTEIEIDVAQDEELLDLLTNDEPVPSDGSITMTGIFIKRSEKKN